MAKNRGDFNRKIEKIDKIMTKMPPTVISGAWNENGLFDIDPNILKKILSS